MESGETGEKSLEQQMNELGVWDTEWTVGDIISLDDHTADRSNAQSAPSHVSNCLNTESLKGRRPSRITSGNAKKACLTRKATLKTIKDRLCKDKVEGCQILISDDL